MKILWGFVESTPPIFGLLPFTFGTVAGFMALIPSILLLEMRKPMPRIDEKNLEDEYTLAIFQFLTNTSQTMGGATMTIFRSAVDGYNQRSKKANR
jgi:hypothetical protein